MPDDSPSGPARTAISVSSELSERLTQLAIDLSAERRVVVTKGEVVEEAVALLERTRAARKHPPETPTP